VSENHCCSECDPRWPGSRPLAKSETSPATALTKRRPRPAFVLHHEQRADRTPSRFDGKDNVVLLSGAQPGVDLFIDPANGIPRQVNPPREQAAPF
jgi:hypothetical protein